jgi:hypothetical protein
MYYNCMRPNTKTCSCRRQSNKLVLMTGEELFPLLLNRVRSTIEDGRQSDRGWVYVKCTLWMISANYCQTACLLILFEVAISTPYQLYWPFNYNELDNYAH